MLLLLLLLLLALTTDLLRLRRNAWMSPADCACVAPQVPVCAWLLLCGCCGEVRVRKRFSTPTRAFEMRLYACAAAAAAATAAAAAAAAAARLSTY